MTHGVKITKQHGMLMLKSYTRKNISARGNMLKFQLVKMLEQFQEDFFDEDDAVETSQIDEWIDEYFEDEE
jgi:hypothetical protein